jgi:hypothetical protein
MKCFVLRTIKTLGSWTIEWHIQEEEMMFLEKLEDEQEIMHFTGIIE